MKDETEGPRPTAEQRIRDQLEELQKVCDRVAQAHRLLLVQNKPAIDPFMMLLYITALHAELGCYRAVLTQLQGTLLGELEPERTRR